jgi:DNA-binding IclR family transcriptional regulator
MSRERAPRTVQAVQTAFDIVDVLQERGGAGVTELAGELDRSKSTVHCQLTTLLENEYVVKRDDTYRLSLRYLHLGEVVKSRYDVLEVVPSELDDLATETGEVAQFATEEHGRAVYLYKANGEKAVRTASTIGKREYLHCLSLGKAILAHLPRERVVQIVERHGLPRKTANTVTSEEVLFEQLDRVRERGYAIDDEEMISGLRCIAAPVTGPDGVLGAVSISGPSSRMTDERFEDELSALVKRSANIIEINTQFS